MAKREQLRTVIAETTKSITIAEAIRALTKAESGGATHAKLTIQWKQPKAPR